MSEKRVETADDYSARERIEAHLVQERAQLGVVVHHQLSEHDEGAL
jgi:hypothetical protein